MSALAGCNHVEYSTLRQRFKKTMTFWAVLYATLDRRIHHIATTGLRSSAFNSNESAVRRARHLRQISHSLKTDCMRMAAVQLPPCFFALVDLVDQSKKARWFGRGRWSPDNRQMGPVTLRSPVKAIIQRSSREDVAVCQRSPLESRSPTVDPSESRRR